MIKNITCGSKLEFKDCGVTLDDLLGCDDRQFVACAYIALLNRDPDPEGLSYYLARLRAGFSKMELLKQLRTSTEGKTQTVVFQDMDRRIAQYQRGQLPLFGWLFRLIEGTDGNGKRDRLLRSIENNFQILNTDISSYFTSLDTNIANIQITLEDLSKSKLKYSSQYKSTESVQISDIESKLSRISETSRHYFHKSDAILADMHQLIERQNELLSNTSVERSRSTQTILDGLSSNLESLADLNENRFRQIETAVSQGRHLTADQTEGIAVGQDTEQLLSPITETAPSITPRIAEDLRELSTNAASNYDQLTAAAAAYANRAA
jgi:Domain of unknown function (DUF4214)